MPSHPPLWTDFLLCSHCTKKFSTQSDNLPITLLCGHSICKGCVSHVHSEGCRYDQNTKTPNLSQLPPNLALLQIVVYQSEASMPAHVLQMFDNRQLIVGFEHHYEAGIHILENLAMYLCDIKNGILPQRSDLNKPMLRKLVSLIQCQLILERGRLRALSACRALAERVSTELILAHQNPATLSGNLWTAVRARGCQFLGPAMQEEALKLIHLALEDGSELSRKVLVMFVVQKLQQQFPQASKTCIGHVVQLLYRASCFVVKKRDQDSSLMKLKENYRTFLALRREHDTQIVQIAREAGLRITPDQWSALLYGDQGQKSHMQSIIDRLQSGESLKRCIQDLENALDKSSNSQKLRALIPRFEVLSQISDEPAPERESPQNDWNFLIRCLQSTKVIIEELISFMKTHSSTSWREEEVLAQSAKFKTSFCRDMKSKGRCPRGSSCTFAHTDEELRLYRNKRKKSNLGTASAREKVQISPVQQEEGIVKDTDEFSLTNHHDNKAVTSTSDNTSLGQEEPSRHPQYYTPPPLAPILPANPPHPNHPPAPPIPYAIPPPQPPSIPPFQYSSYDAYGQPHLQFNPSQSNVPYIHPIPQQDTRTVRGNNHDMPQKPYVMADQNMSQFTVTVSFQPNPNQGGNHYQSANDPTRHGNEASVVYPVNQNMATHLERDKFLQDARVFTGHFSRDKNNRDISIDSSRNPSIPSTQPQIGLAGYYPIPAQYDSSRFPQPGHPHSVNPVMYHQVERHMYHSPVAAPEAMMHHSIVPSPNPNHLYDPNTNMVIQQNHSLGQNIGNSIIQQALPQTQQPAKQKLIPVMQLPFARFPAQVFDHGQWPLEMNPQMRPIPPQIPLVHSGTIACTKEQRSHDDVVSEGKDKFAIPKSIIDATVRELEQRKGQILNQMIKKQREVLSPTPERHDVLRFISEHLGGEGSSGLVNVMAELDTGTKQVTMRDGDHINPSPAHDERILDDVKMHEIVLERHHTMKSTANVSSMLNDSQLNIRYTSASPGEEDEIIPFSDKPTVSKYGPIARSRTGTGNGRNAQLDTNPDMQLLSTSLERDAASGNVTMPIEAYSSLDTLHATSRLSFSALHGRESLDSSSGKLQQDLPVTSGFEHSSVSLSQATSNTRLVHREQAALQQSRTQSDTEDLELAMELQQIEIGIRQKKQKRAAAVKSHY